nr:MAG TPA: hypothetical protein [Caudoviricetes sp.]
MCYNNLASFADGKFPANKNTASWMLTVGRNRRFD